MHAVMRSLTPATSARKATMWQSEATTKRVGGQPGCFVAITERNDHIPTTGLMQR